VPSTAWNQTGVTIAPHTSRSTSPLRRRPTIAGSTLQAEVPTPLLSTLARLTLDEASVAEWLGRPWPGVIPGFARSDRSAPERFLQPVLLAARCAEEFQ
jgi:hypothetical protein